MTHPALRGHSLANLPGGGYVVQDRAAFTERDDLGMGTRVVEAWIVENTEYWRGLWEMRLAQTAKTSRYAVNKSLQL